MRDHFAVGGKTLRDRLRRTGIPAQQLRSDAALAILWLLVLRRMNWMERPAAECQPAEARPGRSAATRRACAVSAASCRCLGVQRARAAPHPNARPPSSTRACRGALARALTQASRSEVGPGARARAHMPPP
jgi:hypothetical protein